MKKLSQKEAFKIASSYQFDTETMKLGPWTSYSLLNDPKHMCFVLARYKFCAKMLQGKKDILEIGCGDGFGIPIIAQGARYVLGIDVDDRLIKDNSDRLRKIKNLEFKKMSICDGIPQKKFDGIYSVDVIEHLDAPLEKRFMNNSIRCLKNDGVYIIGTPNITANRYATKRSRIQHINLKGHKELKALLDKYFANVFLFSMNDEVLHTGYYPMGHYLFAVGVGVKGNM
ncbi:MAG: class I SAM-dependent methyltransferase [Deltaproteobacteria bacterium]|nr:class I SAM-dependent methyltransferase [Deltaproteobacteria bacterium]